MLYSNDINNLITQWTERVSLPSTSPEYADALRDCIYDLNNLLSKSIDEELSYQDFLEMEADSYLSSMENHERVA